jgi:hypothetical protein
MHRYNMLYVYPVDEASGHTRSGGQMAGTVHDMILFTLCLMQLGMASFFYIKEPDHFSVSAQPDPPSTTLLPTQQWSGNYV